MYASNSDLGAPLHPYLIHLFFYSYHDYTNSLNDNMKSDYFDLHHLFFIFAFPLVFGHRPVAVGTAGYVAGIDEAAEAAEVDCAAAVQAEPGDAEYNRLPSPRTLLRVYPLLRCYHLEWTKTPDGFVPGRCANPLQILRELPHQQP